MYISDCDPLIHFINHTHFSSKKKIYWTWAQNLVWLIFKSLSDKFHLLMIKDFKRLSFYTIVYINNDLITNSNFKYEYLEHEFNIKPLNLFFS